MIRDRLNVLINLAASDNFVAENEARLIYMIGQANGVPREEIDEMLKEPKPKTGTLGSTFNHTGNIGNDQLAGLVQRSNTKLRSERCERIRCHRRPRARRCSQKCRFTSFSLRSESNCKYCLIVIHVILISATLHYQCHNNQTRYV